jgi:uncharacterized LabA/DUF88 family protein
VDTYPPADTPQGLGRGYFLVYDPGMRSEPRTKRVIAFIDGQNLYHCARTAFGYSYPNYDVRKLVLALCQSKQWQLSEVRFYTGIPDARDDPRWHAFWSKKLAVMGRAGVHVFSRPLRYRNQSMTLPDGSTHTVLVGEEKGIDVRLALDVIRLAHRNEYDVALVLSQDQDLSEAADEVKLISQEQLRWIRVASAFPDSPTVKNRRGINGTEWIRIDRKLFDRCIDPRDYRTQSAA